jgi:hypothetical protein
MLVDFLKGNNLSKVLATLPGLWAASRESQPRVTDHGLDTTGHQHLWGVLGVLAVGPSPLVEPGGCLMSRDWHLEGSRSPRS